MKFIITPLLTLLLFACSTENRETKQPLANATPEVLQQSNSKVYASIKSDYKRGKINLLEQLYQEALENDATLALLDEQFHDLNDLKSDSLHDYREYKDNLQGYYSSASHYINSIQDSVFRADTRAHFNSLETRINEKLKNHQRTLAKLEQSELMLNDQFVIMKLLVTHNMLSNYEENEFPSIHPIKRVQDIIATLNRNTSTIIKSTE